ncbi:hypothetical protein QAD02_006459 [Eretmocerus hayati]|uniref:Uncharacterized protein n=1 Tax=Eretmocerus hayati TaxID=131215 RepID=A0ACC2N398_9HYME|nr:hypothetical protein QAD02_006459 [Eretmocerus hayati]
MKEKVCIFIVLMIFSTSESASDNDMIQDSSRLKLKLISVVFRHGDRTPLKNEIYPNDPNKDKGNFPEGYGQLTIKGERRSFNLGRNLRERYNDHLDSKFSQGDIDAISTNVNRTKKTLELLLEGLYPDWYQEITKKVLDNGENLLSTSKCPRFGAESKKLMNNPRAEAEISKFDDFMIYLNAVTGRKVSDPGDMLQLYLLLDAESSMGLELPSWTKKVYPDGRLLNGAVLAYRLNSYSDLLKKLNGGKVLQDIIRKMKSVEWDENQTHAKVNLYSAHESNLAALLIALGINEPQVPKFSSAVVIEFYEGRHQYYVKVLQYRRRASDIFETLQIPGCSTLCPFDEFQNLLKNVTSTDRSICELR